MALNALGLGLIFTAKDLATGVMGKVRNGFAQTRDELGRFGHRSKEAFRDFAIGTAIMGAGLGGLAILGSTIDEAAEFGKAIALVRSEVDEATFSQEAMKDITIDLGKQFGKLPKDEAAALYKAVALGANTAAKSTALMTSANQLAVAGNSELTVTMDALGGTLNAYHMNMSRASEVSDAMFTAMKGGNTTVGDIASAIGRVAPGAYEMGISLQELLGSMAVMTNKGIKASEAVSGLHGALANIVHPSADAAAEAARLGIKFNAAAVRAQGFQKFMHSITDSAKFNKDSLSKLFTSVEGSNAMAMLAGDMGSVDQIMKDMKNGAGATAAGFEIMAGTLSFQGDRFKALFSALKIRVGEFLEPLAARGLGIINRLMDAFTNLPGPVQGTIVHIALAAAAMVTLVGAVVAGIAAFKIIGAAMVTFGAGAGGALAAAILPAIGLIGLAVATFLAFRTAVEKDIGGSGTYLRQVFAGIKLAFDATVQLFSQGGFSGAVRDEFLKGENPAINFAIRIYTLVGRIKNFFRGISAGFSAAVDEMGPTFQLFWSSLERLSASFGVVWDAADPKGTGEKFDNFGQAGRRVGVLIAKVVDATIQLSAAFIDIVVFLKPFGDLVVDLTDHLGGLKGVIELLEGAFVFFAARAVLTTGAAFVSATLSAAGLSVGLGTTAAAATTAGIAATGASGGIAAMGAAAATALGPITLAAAAVAALYMASKTLNDLDKKYHGKGWSAWWMNAKHNLGVTSDSEYWQQRNMMGGEGDPASTPGTYEYAHRNETAFGGAGGEFGIPGVNMSDPNTMPVLASMSGGPNQTIDTDAIGRAAAEAAKAMQPPKQQIIVMIDGQEVASAVKKSNDSSDARSFTPTTPEDGG